MRITSKSVLLLLGIFLILPAFAQQKKGAQKKIPTTGKPVSYAVSFSGIMPDSILTRQQLLILAQTPLSTVVPNGRITHFNFSTIQHNLYEDSVGNLMWLSEPNTEVCMGDTLPRYILENMATSLRPGDTVWFERIKIKNAKGETVDGKPLRMTIKK